MTRQEKRKFLIDNYLSHSLLNVLDKNGCLECDGYIYKYENDKLILCDIRAKVFKGNSLIIDDSFDVLRVDFTRKKYNVLKMIDLGHISKIEDILWDSKDAYMNTNLEVFTANHLKKVPHEYFTYCEKLSKVNIPVCRYIDYGAFCNTNIESLNVPSMQVIDAESFVYSNIKSLNVGNIRFKEDALSGAKSLKNIKCKSIKYLSISSGLYYPSRIILDSLDTGIFYENKEYWWVNNLEHLKKLRPMEEILESTKVYKQLYGLPKDKYAVHNNCINWKKFLYHTDVRIELDKTLINMGLTDYYIRVIQNYMSTEKNKIVIIIENKSVVIEHGIIVK